MVESAGNVVNFTVTLNGMTERNISVVASTQSGGEVECNALCIEYLCEVTFTNILMHCVLSIYVR